MRILNYLSLIAFLILPTTGFANTWFDRGNGGLAVQCEGQNLQVLDLYEAANNPSVKVSFSNAATYTDKVAELIQRIDKLDPVRAAFYRQAMQSFAASVEFVDGDLGLTPDAGLVVLKRGCELKQVAFQRNPSLFNKQRYVISRYLWDQLDEDNKAALVLHEVIYFQFMDAGSTEMTSERVRFLNILIHGNVLAGLSQQDYIQALQDMRFLDYSIDGIKISLGEFDGNGTWQKAYIDFDQGQVRLAYAVAAQTIDKPYLQYHCVAPTVPTLATVTFNANGKLEALAVLAKFIGGSGCQYPSMNYDGFEGSSKFIYGLKWEFYSNGQPKMIKGLASSFSSVQYAGLTFTRVNTGAESDNQAIFAFGPNFDLVQLSLGGVPCRVFGKESVLFSATPMGAESIVKIRAGELATALPICFKTSK
jgi:hypothetical protein